jgi:hypothetical protein
VRLSGDCAWVGCAIVAFPAWQITRRRAHADHAHGLFCAPPHHATPHPLVSRAFHPGDMFQSSSYPVPSARTAFVMRTSQLAALQVPRVTSYPPVTGDVLHDWSDEHALAIIKAAAEAIRRHGASQHRLLIVCVTHFPHCVFVTFCAGTAPSSMAAHLSAHSVRAAGHINSGDVC